MRLYVLAAATLVTLASFNSCKKDPPAYCTNEYFGEVFTTDSQDDLPTTTFGLGENIVFNWNFTNSSGDSLHVNYTEPWVEYTITSNGQLVATTSPVIPESGLNTAALANGQAIMDSFQYTPTLPVGTYTLTARCYYEIMGDCDNGLRVTEKMVDFTIAP